MNLTETQKALRVAKTEIAHLYQALKEIAASTHGDADDLGRQARDAISRHSPRFEQEAEELRAGIEKLLEEPSSARSIARDVIDDYGSDDHFVKVSELQELLEHVDARDSLAYREREK